MSRENESFFNLNAGIEFGGNIRLPRVLKYETLNTELKLCLSVMYSDSKICLGVMLVYDLELC